MKLVWQVIETPGTSDYVVQGSAAPEAVPATELFEYKIIVTPKLISLNANGETLKEYTVTISSYEDDFEKNHKKIIKQYKEIADQHYSNRQPNKLRFESVPEEEKYSLDRFPLSRAHVSGNIYYEAAMRYSSRGAVFRVDLTPGRYRYEKAGEGDNWEELCHKANLHNENYDHPPTLLEKLTPTWTPAKPAAAPQLNWKLTSTPTDQYHVLESCKNRVGVLIDTEELVDYVIIFKIGKISAKINGEVVYSFDPYSSSEWKKFDEVFTKKLSRAWECCEQHFRQRAAGKLQFEVIGEGRDKIFRHVGANYVYEIHKRFSKWVSLRITAGKGDYGYKNLGSNDYFDDALARLNTIVKQEEASTSPPAVSPEALPDGSSDAPAVSVGTSWWEQQRQKIVVACARALGDKSV